MGKSGHYHRKQNHNGKLQSVASEKEMKKRLGIDITI